MTPFSYLRTRIQWTLTESSWILKGSDLNGTKTGVPCRFDCSVDIWTSCSNSDGNNMAAGFIIKRMIIGLGIFIKPGEISLLPHH